MHTFYFSEIWMEKYRRLKETETICLRLTLGTLLSIVCFYSGSSEARMEKVILWKRRLSPEFIPVNSNRS